MNRTFAMAVALGLAGILPSAFGQAVVGNYYNPYGVYGGGHASFNSAGYDCSGSVSFALHGAHLLATPLDSTQFESYGDPGRGRWITLYANAGHVFMDVAGLWFDTAAQSAQNGNDRWSATRVSPGNGWVIRHPAGW